MSSPTTAGRSGVVLVVALVGLQTRQADHQLMMALLLLAAFALAMAACLGRLGPLEGLLGRVSPVALARAVVVLGAALAGFQLAATLAATLAPGRSVGPALAVGLAALAATVLAVATSDRRRSGVAFAALLLSVGTALVVVILTVHPVIDVAVLLDQGVSRVLHLASPYGGSIPNPYPAEETSRFYDASLVGGDRILIGYPYLPASLIPAVVGHLLGDVRLAAAACVLLTGVAVRRLAGDDVGRILAVGVVFSPLTVPVVAGYWVEPAVGLFLALGVLGVREGRRGLAVLGLGLLLASKQYVVVALPLLLLLRRRCGTASSVVAIGLAAGLCAPFLLAGPAAFVDDVVRTQLLQPYRPESISLLVAVGNTVGHPPAWLTGALPLAAGIAVSSALVRCSRLDEAAALAATVALSLFATVLLSKQAFTNYYYLVEIALLLTAVSWRPARRGPDRPGARDTRRRTGAATAA